VHILGLSAFYHDSAACLLRDGEIIAAAQEERFTRKKHDASFPAHATRYCLREAGIDYEDLDLVVFYEKPLLKLERLLESFLAHAPRGFGLFRISAPSWIKHKLHIPRELDRGLEKRYRGRYVFTEHHEAHAASAFYPSPFDEAAVLTLDGAGEWATGSIGHGRGRQLQMLRELRFPHSLGLLYSALTYFTGFRVNSGEYKLMGLAPYGEPVYRDVILRELVQLEPDGSFRLAMRYFAFEHAAVMTGKAFEALFDGPAREPEAPLTQREMNLAASIQAVLEEILLRIARHAHALTGADNLVLAGGVALNCVAVGRLKREGPFKRVWVQPAAGDAGGALGCALFAWHELLEHERTPSADDGQRGSLLGPQLSHSEIVDALRELGAPFHEPEDERALCARVAELLASGKVVGHFAGRMEFGPRALGNRSILADARAPDMQAILNAKIKFRESFRPFAPAILREHVHEYFECAEAEDNPYMSFVAHVHPDKRLELTDRASGMRDFARLSQPHSVIPAVTHLDHSARIQTVDERRNPRFHALLSAFAARTGCPVLINTSLNVRGEPIVNSVQEAYRCLMSTGMDALVLENVIVYQHEQPSHKRTTPALGPD
jgi:carbamoyltransferase